VSSVAGRLCSRGHPLGWTCCAEKNFEKSSGRILADANDSGMDTKSVHSESPSPIAEADFVRLFARHELALRNYARLILPDWGAVDDVLQEMLPWIDAIAIQPHFRRTFPRRQFEEIYQLSGKPILLCDFAIRFKDGDKNVQMWKIEEDSVAAGQAYAEYVTAAMESAYILGVFWCNPVDTQKGFRKPGVKQGFFGDGLSERPGLHETVRRLNAYRDQITPEGIR